MGLKAARIEIAVQLCISFPELYPKLKSKRPVFISRKELAAAEVLRAMLKQEPAIKHILDFHYKRQN